MNIRDLAHRAGVRTLAPQRARAAVERLLASVESQGPSVRILAGAGEMGSTALGSLIEHRTVTSAADHQGASTADDTLSIATRMVEQGIDLLLFAGGDGTARDILDAVGSAVPVLGIPAGVKIYSAVFGITPTETGLLAAGWLSSSNRATVERDVVDIDEDAMRRGVAVPSLYGSLLVPADSRRLQPRKSASPASDANAVKSLGLAFAGGMDPHRLYVLGPGGTTAAIGAALGLQTTRLGVDVICNGMLVATDVDADRLEALVPTEGATLVVTPLGSQGFIIGRGNQQIGHRVLARSQLQVVATPAKIISLGGRPLWVDSGDSEVNAALCGYTQVFTGAKAEVMYPVGTSLDGC
ncbi:ATP-NAD kinase family protein [Arthrobacter psychrolactophilus]